MEDRAALMKQAEIVIINNGDLDSFLLKIKHQDPIIYLEILQYVLILEENEKEIINGNHK